MYRVLIICFSAFLLGMHSGYAQKEKEKMENIPVMDVSGKAFDTDMKKADRMALAKAKENALNKAGISEQIHVQKALNKAEINGNYQDVFSSNVFSNLNGVVKDVQITGTEHKIVNNDMVESTLRINCTVVKYNVSPDPMFSVGVKGVKDFYAHNEALKFKTVSSKDCYLKAWIFTEEDAFRLYPNDYEKDKLLPAEDSIRFPLNPLIDYTLDSEGHSSQINRLIMVFMKKDYPYNDEISYENIYNWICSLPPDQRLVKYHSFTIFANE